MKVLIAAFHKLDLWIAPKWFAERLSATFPQLEVARLGSEEDLSQQIASAEIAFTPSLSSEQFHAARSLKWIHSPAAAIHQLLFPELVDSNVILTNAREVHGPVVAEHVLALMFALARRIPESVRFQRDRVWGQEILWHNHQTPRELAEATLGLIGMGSIGRSVAQRAFALGMKIIAVRKHPEEDRPDFVHEVLPSSRLNDMLARAEYVVLSPPVTPQTRGMIGREQLAQMRPDAYLINVGRGTLVNEPDLIEALREKKIAGAGLDVFENEPLPEDSPFWDLENVLITPHTAGMTEKLWERHYQLFSENLRRFLGGEPLLGLVDKKGGY